MRNTLKGNLNFQLQLSPDRNKVTVSGSDGTNTVVRQTDAGGVTYAPTVIALADEVIELFNGKKLKRRRYKLIIE